jgi:formimidoylglutamate deiminase
MTTLYAESALLPDGWAAGVAIALADDGTIARVDRLAGSPPEEWEVLEGPVLAGIPNLHSHAFQRAMAGRAERASPGGDDFWSWRDVMYGFVGRLEPEDVEAIAAQLQVEMLKAGYTAVAEFHYLHNGADGEPYEDPALMSRRILAAARRTGIGLTHLPVLYAAAGFGGAPLAERQRRFAGDAGRILAIVEALAKEAAGDGQLRIGVAPHSLRAVPPEALAELLAGLAALDPMAPVHIHIAEQVREVEECLGATGARPVEWLLHNAPVDGRWTLVHATHMTPAETGALAASDAVAGLCPTTEANLGDGLFPLAPYLKGGGKAGIGSDSHISVSPWEELRWLEYGQRLAHRRRAVAAAPRSPSVGARLIAMALEGGAQAMGRSVGKIEAGARADLIVLDPDLPALAAAAGDMLLDAAVFAGNLCPVLHVMVGGRWRVRDRRHEEEEEILAAFRRSMRRLTA